jgi:hypothetical protein
VYFRDRVLGTICLCWLQTLILLISASWVARIIDVSHRCPPACEHFYIYNVHMCELRFCNSRISHFLLSLLGLCFSLSAAVPLIPLTVQATFHASDSGKTQLLYWKKFRLCWALELYVVCLDEVVSQVFSVVSWIGSEGQSWKVLGYASWEGIIIFRASFLACVQAWAGCLHLLPSPRLWKSYVRSRPTAVREQR